MASKMRLNAINEDKLDGWALHTYGSPYLRLCGHGMETSCVNALCD